MTIFFAFLIIRGEEAGAVRLGQTVNVDGIVVPANELFYSTARRASDSPWPDGAGMTNFCFTGKSGRDFLLVRWNQGAINFYKGVSVANAELMKFN